MQRARRILATLCIHHQRPSLGKRDASLPRQIWLGVPLQPNNDTTFARRAVKSGAAILESSERSWSPYEPLLFSPSYSTRPASAADVTNGNHLPSRHQFHSLVAECVSFFALLPPRCICCIVSHIHAYTRTISSTIQLVVVVDRWRRC